MDTARIQQGLSGPIASIRTPFTRDGLIDYGSLRQMVEFDIEAGAGTLLITWCDSLFAVLSDQDIADITKAVVEYCQGRAVVAACTGRWATPQAVEFAAHCQGIGIDILQVFLPMWYPGCLSVETAVEHHRAIATQIPVMANSAELQRADGLGAARALIEGAVNVVAMKADITGDYDRTMTSLVHDHWTVFAGGQKSFHLELMPYGCQGYLSTFITFMPQVTNAYWRAITAGDTVTAVKIIETIDRPFFETILAAPGGFDAAMHGIMELCGLAQRWRRAPFSSLNDEAMEQLTDLLHHLRTTVSEICVRALVEELEIS